MDKNSKQDARQADVSRRRFIKHTVIGGIALAYTSGVGKFIASIVPDDTSQKMYLNDLLPGDRVMMEREYVVMSKEEKEELVRMFVENYKVANNQ